MVVAGCSSANAQKIVGEIREVLVETVGHITGDNASSINEADDPDGVTALTGRLGNNLLVHFEGKRSLVGEIVEVRLDECKDFYYIGSLV